MKVQHRFCWIGTLVLALALAACGEGVVEPAESRTPPQAVAFVPGLQAQSTSTALPVHDPNHPAIPDSVGWDSTNVIEITDTNGQWRVERFVATGGSGYFSHATIDLNGQRVGTLRPVYSAGVITEVRFEPTFTPGEWIDGEEGTGTILDSSQPLPDGECDPLRDEGCCEDGGENLHGALGDGGGGCEAELNYVALDSFSASTTIEDGPDDLCWDEFQTVTTELGSSLGLFLTAARFFAVPEPTGATKLIAGGAFTGGLVQGARGLISAGFYFHCHLAN